MLRASPERVFSHIAQSEHLPRYATPLWMAADPPEKRGSTQVVTLRGYFAGLPLESVQRLTFHPPSSVEFTQIRGTLRLLNGRIALRSVEDGTEVLFSLDVDPAIAMITEDTARQFLVQVMGRMLDRLKLAAERKAPSRVRPPVAAAGAAQADREEEDIEEAPSPPPAAAADLPLAGTGTPAAVPPVPSMGGEPPAHAVEKSGAGPSPGRQVGGPAGGQPSGAPPGGRRRRRRRRRRRPGDLSQPGDARGAVTR